MSDLTSPSAAAMEQTASSCCPPTEPEQVCDILDFHYRLTHNPTVVINDRRQVVPVEVKLHVRIERCAGPLALGNLLYSTTLLPGEKVKLFTSDRRSRFSFDTASKLSYRSEQTSEEAFFMSAMSDSMSDVRVRDSANSSNTSNGSAEGHGETSGAIQSFFGGASLDVSGSYNSSSTSTFLRELSQHSQSSSHSATQGVRAASSVSVGEVATRTHTESESQDHFESASREFSNPNRCRAVTFLFYQINKTQTVKFTIESIERRVLLDNTKVDRNPGVLRGGVTAAPSKVLATDSKRLEIEKIGRDSAAIYQSRGANAPGLRLTSATLQGATIAAPADPLTDQFHEQALRQVEEELVKQGLLDQVGREGKISEETKSLFSYEIKSSLPTPGVLVKGCLDDCQICEPTLEQDIQLDLERKQLENDLLRRQIELLERSKDYRPAEDDNDADDN